MFPCPICGSNERESFLEGPDRFNGDEHLHRLVRCPGCRLVWLENPPKPAEMGKHYGPNYDRFIGRAGDNSDQRWRSRRETISSYKSSGKILDLGCSSGSFLETLKGEAWELFGVEMSPEAAAQAITRSGANVFVGDILDATFEPGSFDAITCFDVLEHVYEPLKVMAKVHQWLKPNGIFYTLVPNIESGEARLYGSYWYALELPRHLLHFCPTSLKYLAESVGLQVASLEVHRNSAAQYSFHYLSDAVLAQIGILRKPLADAKAPNIPARVVRKALGWTVFAACYHLAGMIGPGESIHAVFQAPGPR